MPNPSSGLGDANGKSEESSSPREAAAAMASPSVERVTSLRSDGSLRRFYSRSRSLGGEGSGDSNENGITWSGSGGKPEFVKQDSLRSDGHLRRFYSAKEERSSREVVDDDDGGFVSDDDKDDEEDSEDNEDDNGGGGDSGVVHFQRQESLRSDGSLRRFYSGNGRASKREMVDADDGVFSDDVGNGGALSSESEREDGGPVREGSLRSDGILRRFYSAKGSPLAGGRGGRVVEGDGAPLGVEGEDDDNGECSASEGDGIEVYDSGSASEEESGNLANGVGGPHIDVSSGEEGEHPARKDPESVNPSAARPFLGGAESSSSAVPTVPLPPPGCEDLVRERDGGPLGLPDGATRDRGRGAGSGKVCVLSIDGGGMRGIIPGKVLAVLETMLQEKTGNPKACIADYFDLVAGTSAGALLLSMLFTPDENGAPLMSAAKAWHFLQEYGKDIFKQPRWSRLLIASLRPLVRPKYSRKPFERLLKQSLIRRGKPVTLRQLMKPALIPCFDLEHAGPFLFSRSAAIDSESCNFNLWEVLRATTAVPGLFPPARLSSLDRNTSVTAVDGGLIMNNPTAVALTHVLRNEKEFPGATTVGNLLVLSLGTGQFDHVHSYKGTRKWGLGQWALPIVRIVMDGSSDVVDHTSAMAFGSAAYDSYVRIQASGLRKSALMEMDDPSRSNVKRLVNIAKELLASPAQRRLPSGGREDLDQTNEERLSWLADELIKEKRAREDRDEPTVRLQQSCSLKVRATGHVNYAECHSIIKREVHKRSVGFFPLVSPSSSDRSTDQS